jgi:hypothetical protein
VHLNYKRFAILDEFYRILVVIIFDPLTSGRVGFMSLAGANPGPLLFCEFDTPVFEAKN